MNKEAPIGATFDITESLITVRLKRHQLVPILIWQYLSLSQKESAPIGASLFILTVLLRDIVRSRSAPIGARLDITVQMKRQKLVPLNSFCVPESIVISRRNKERYCQIKIGTNWCRFWYHRISHYSSNEEAPIGADFDLTISLIT